MVALSRCVSSVALLVASAHGARISRKNAKETRDGKFIAGVPVLNYHTAYAGEASLSQVESEGEWVVMLNAGTTDAQIEKMCLRRPGPIYTYIYIYIYLYLAFCPWEIWKKWTERHGHSANVRQSDFDLKNTVVIAPASLTAPNFGFLAIIRV